MIDQLKDLKDTFENARKAIDTGKEPLEDLIKLQGFLQAIHADPTGFLEKADKDYKRYFLEEFSIGLLRRLTRERSRDDKYLDVISQVLEAYMLIFVDFLKIGVYNQQFFDSIKFIFEHDSILHNYNYQIPEDQLKTLRSANQEWRKAFQVGDMVDAIADENNVRCNGWSQARISSINGDILQLEYIYDAKAIDRFTDRWSVEIAPFESKTKELWEWKASIKIGDHVDANDKSVWNKSTILDIKENQLGPDRIIKMAYIGYRVYTETGNKSDEKGTFEGWSAKFDEWIPIYNPRIMPFYSKTQKGTSDDHDLDEDLDNLLQPEEGFTRVYAVPRIRKCISSVFMHLINLFGHLGGFDLVLNFIQKATQPPAEGSEEQKEKEADSFDLNILASLVECISTCYLVYHKDFIQEYGHKFVEVCTKALKDSPEKSLRNVRREKIESIIKSIDKFQRRLITKDEREKQTEVLKLDIALLCLRSSYMERRIQGLRDLNNIIKNMRMFSTNKAFTPQFLIEWMEQNEVFAQLFDPKKTHLNLVQRTTDVLKLLLAENKFTQELMEQFWSLTKADYKFEIYKIINEISFYLRPEHIDYFFEQIRQIPSEKLAIEEFQCLSELGKFAKDDQFKVKVSDFFWEIICNSDNVKEELVNSCINKFCEMVKNWDMSRKHYFFTVLTKNLSQNKSSISSIRLFKGLVKDQKDRMTYNYNSSPQRYPQSSSMIQPQMMNQQANEIQQEMTLQKSLGLIIQDEALPKVLLDNLTHYCNQARTKVTEQAKVETRKKVFLVNPKYSHHDEIDERLQFLKYVSSIVTEYQISKAELGIIYSLLYQNPILPSDPEEFLTWCKSSCEQSTTVSQILDLNEVGMFFTEKMTSGELDVKNLVIVGFDFLQQYFLSVNESQQSIMKVQPKQPKQQKYNTGYGYSSITYGYNANGTYGPKYYNNYQNNQKQEEEASQQFKLIKPPSQLDKLDIVWNIALHCENDKVVPKAIDFLIKVYYSLDADLDDQKLAIQDELIEKCMSILRSANDPHTIERVIEITKCIIKETEKKGTGDVKPHNALLKGELLENIQVKYKAQGKMKGIVMRIYSNATVWEFKKEVARQFELAPKYLKLEIGTSKVIKDTENGKTLAQLGLKSNDQLTAYKIHIEEEIPNAPLTGPDGKLTEKARAIFNEWFDMYSDENGQMTKETCANFIKGCTGETPPANDDRILNLFKTYDTNNDGKIERADFIIFYETSARNKPDTVRENLRSHNIRNDLKKLSEVTEESSFKTEDMPRFKISKNQDQFDLLISILDRPDSASQASWDLIQMLATNQELYKRVLQLKIAQDPATGKIDWSKFFDGQSVYKLLYTLQIVEAVMEEGEGEGLESVQVINDDDANKKKNIPTPPPLVGPMPPGISIGTDDMVELAKADSEVKEVKETTEPVGPSMFKRSSTVVTNHDEDKRLKSEWTKMFLEHNGFQYILKIFMDKEIKQEGKQTKSSFELKHVAFLLKLLRIFIMAAFSTSTESSIYESSVLIKRSSNVTEEDQMIQQKKDTDNSRFAELQKQMQGPIGEEIIQTIDYKELQQKILKLISQILDSRQNDKDMTFEEKLIIENALSLWVGCILHKKDLLNDFYDFDSESFILKGLLQSNQDKVREEFKLSLSQLAQKLLSGDNVREIPLLYLLKLLSSKFSIIQQYHCKQYFDLFCELIDHYFTYQSTQKAKSDVFNPESLLALIIDKIKEYNQVATTNESNNDEASAIKASSQEQEEIYIGLIQLTSKIIDNFDISFTEKIVEQKSLIDEIFVNFLFKTAFSQDNANSLDNLKIKPKKKSSGDDGKKGGYGKRSKDSAYKLLNSLIRKSPLLMNCFLEKSLLPLLQLVKRQEKWNYQPPSQIEKASKYVGLYNPACICYMNSMLQQFFMIPAFRYNILSVDDNLPEELVEHKNAKIDDNMLHQFQKVMANLELSPRMDYNPTEFCFAFKDFEGNPTNLGEQKDAQEFLNMLFDRLENQLRPTSMKYLLQSIFCGQTCYQNVCKECGKCRNRIEDYYNLSVTVKDIKSLHESLQKLIEGEVINDYDCDNCKKKVDISRRQLLSSAPNVLIVHLQRMCFNFETFRNDKINSFFEFPLQLDLKPYSFYEVMRKEGRLKKQGEDGEEGEVEQKPEQDEDNPWPEEEECFEYKLVGVEVHSGSANAGHYWSLINTKRGVDEPDESDPNWNKSESDPWMKFNDSSVTEYNPEKLREDCFGGDGRSGESDSWSFGGSYGQSAYMLVYEKRQKRPLKILATPEEVEKNKEKLEFDEKKGEHYKLINYRDIVEDVAPNKIYKQVYEENYKLDFENDIYSSEFFEFIRQIINAVFALNKDRKNHGVPELQSAKQNVLTVSKKTILDLLAKCYQNTSIKFLVESLIELLNTDDNLCVQFLEQCFKDDNCNYLFEIMLECSDGVARNHVSNLVKFLLNKLKVIEKDRLYDIQKVEHEIKGEKVTFDQHVALSARFINKALNLLTTQVARNWSRFDNFLEVIQVFALGIEAPKTGTQSTVPTEKNPDDEIGLEFMFRVSFIEKACDFILGKKSPLCQPSEKRYEMGGSYTQANFTPIIKIVTKMIQHQEFLEKYPLTEMEKKMFLHQDFLKVMLGSGASAKQFGQCLGNMCKDNLHLSRKVSKVFIKAINGSNSDNLKAYLKALKPFLRIDDQYKTLKLEWIFGFSQINQRKTYREDKYKYGLELVDRINEEATTYMTPLASGQNEESLLSQLLKCKGKHDTNCILCLQEMLHLMTKDDAIARFVYNQPPQTYQFARFTDWFRIYLENQRTDTEKSNSYNSYFKNKFDSIIKSLGYLERVEQKFELFREEEKNAYEKAKSEEGKEFEEVEKDWLAYKNPDVIKHYPPHIIIGRQVVDDKEFLVYDEDPNVKVSIYEIACEYNYSNPTGIFNISIPHIEAKTSMYQTMSYMQFKRTLMEMERRRQLEEQQAHQSDGESTQISTSDSEKDPQDGPQQHQLTPVKDEDIEVVNWFQNRKEAPMLLKVVVTNKERNKVSVNVQLVGDETTNVNLPKSSMKLTFFDQDTRLLCHLQKKDPRKPFGTINVVVTSKIDQSIMAASSKPSAPSINIRTICIGFDTNGKKVGCWNCAWMNDYGMDYCEKCGESLNDTSSYSEPGLASIGFIENYYGGGTGGDGANFMS